MTQTGEAKARRARRLPIAHVADTRGFVGRCRCKEATA